MTKITVSSECTGCETCVNSCPASVYEIKNGKSIPVRAEGCTLCRTCESNCPQGAIQIVEEEETKLVKPKPAKAEHAKKETKKKTPNKPAKSKKRSAH